MHYLLSTLYVYSTLLDAVSDQCLCLTSEHMIVSLKQNYILGKG